METEKLNDIFERVVWTFLQGAAAAYPTGLVVSDWSTLKNLGVTLAIAGGAAVLALAKGIVRARKA